MKLTGTIVTYHNNINILKQAIDSFLNTEVENKLYIIDNSKDENIKNLCLSTNGSVEYLGLEKNIGFGAGHNIIMKDLTKMGQYHLVLNPDIRFDVGVLEELVSFMDENTNVGNIMPKILYPDGSTQYLCKLLPTPMDWIGRLVIPIKSIRNKINDRFEMRFTGYDKIMDVPYLSGCFMFLRKEAIERIGIFDEGIFMYGEDTDLNRRIRTEYRTLFYPRVTIIHDFERGSHKEWRLLKIHIAAAIYYFNKWGWFFDRDRRLINNEIVELHLKSIK